MESSPGMDPRQIQRVWSDGLSAEQLKQSLESIPSALSGRTLSPMGEACRSEHLASMDMLNEMFQRQARRLETQLYQRAQDQHALQLAQQKAQMAQIAQQQVRNLEELHAQQAAKLSQGARSLQLVQQKATRLVEEVGSVVTFYEALHHDVGQLRDSLGRENPQALQQLELKSVGFDAGHIDALRKGASELQAIVHEMERAAIEHVSATPSTPVVMSSDGNVDGLALLASTAQPLQDLSAAAAEPMAIALDAPGVRS